VTCLQVIYGKGSIVCIYVIYAFYVSLYPFCVRKYKQGPKISQSTKVKLAISEFLARSEIPPEPTRLKRVSRKAQFSSQLAISDLHAISVFCPKPTRYKRVHSEFKKFNRIRGTWSTTIGAEQISCNSLIASEFSYKKVCPDLARINSFLFSFHGIYHCIITFFWFLERELGHI